MRGLIFADYKEHLKHKDLNRAYGHLGMTFDTRKAALAHKATLDNAYVSRIVNYKMVDVVTTAVGGKAIDGAKPYTIGWLVTDTSQTN